MVKHNQIGYAIVSMYHARVTEKQPIRKFQHCFRVAPHEFLFPEHVIEKYESKPETLGRQIKQDFSVFQCTHRIER